MQFFAQSQREPEIGISNLIGINQRCNSNMPIPTDKTGVYDAYLEWSIFQQSHSKYVNNYNTTMRTDIHFQWADKHDKALDKLKSHSNITTLAIFQSQSAQTFPHETKHSNVHTRVLLETKLSQLSLLDMCNAGALNIVPCCMLTMLTPQILTQNTINFVKQQHYS